MIEKSRNVKRTTPPMRLPLMQSWAWRWREMVASRAKKNLWCKDPQHARLGSAISRACNVMHHTTPPTAACDMTYWHLTYLPLMLPLTLRPRSLSTLPRPSPSAPCFTSINTPKTLVQCRLTPLSARHLKSCCCPCAHCAQCLLHRRLNLDPPGFLLQLAHTLLYIGSLTSLLPDSSPVISYFIFSLVLSILQLPLTA